MIAEVRFCNEDGSTAFMVPVRFVPIPDAKPGDVQYELDAQAWVRTALIQSAGAGFCGQNPCVCTNPTHPGHHK